MDPITLLDFLYKIQKDQGGFFQVSTKKDGAEWDGEYGFFNLDDVDVSGKKFWFTNRLYPHKFLHNRKASSGKPIKFVRIDLELEDHSKVPSKEERKIAKEFGISSGAACGINTPHGVHLFYVLRVPIADCHLKLFVRDLMSEYPGEMHADVPSWHPACMSRYVEKLEFYQDSKIDWVAPIVNVPPRSDKKLNKSYLYSKIQLYKVLNLKNQGFPDVDIMKFTGISKADLSDIYSNPNFNFNPEDQQDCLVPLGPTCLRRLNEQQTYKMFADRWWSYQSSRYCGISEPEDLILYVKQDPEYLTIRYFISENFKLKGKELDEWIEADVLAQFKKYPDGFVRQSVSKAKIIAIKTILGKRKQVKASELAQFNKSLLSKAFKIIGWESKKVGKVWIWFKVGKQENSYEKRNNEIKSVDRAEPRKIQSVSCSELKRDLSLGLDVRGCATGNVRNARSSRSEISNDGENKCSEFVSVG